MLNLIFKNKFKTIFQTCNLKINKNKFKMNFKNQFILNTNRINKIRSAKFYFHREMQSAKKTSSKDNEHFFEK